MSPKHAIPRLLGAFLFVAVVPVCALGAETGSAARAASMAPGDSVAIPESGIAQEGAAEAFTVVGSGVEGAEPEGPGEKLAGMAGRLHPALTHFPVAWILLAAGCEWAALFLAWRHSAAGRKFPRVGRNWRARGRRLGDASLALLVLAAASAGVAAASGHVLASGKDAEPLLALHGRFAYATVTLGILALAARFISRKRGSRVWRIASALLLAAAAGTVAYTGHLGGSLVFGEGYIQAGGKDP